MTADHVAYVDEQWKVLEPYTSGFYVNDPANETQAQVDANYGANLVIARLCFPENMNREHSLAHALSGFFPTQQVGYPICTLTSSSEHRDPEIVHQQAGIAR